MIVGFIFFSILTLYSDIKFWNVEYQGVITNRESVCHDSDDGISCKFKYKILVNDDVYFAMTGRSDYYEENDNVIIKPSGNFSSTHFYVEHNPHGKYRTGKILYINGEKVANRLGAQDYVSMTYLFLVILIGTIIIKSKF